MGKLLDVNRDYAVDEAEFVEGIERLQVRRSSAETLHAAGCKKALKGSMELREPGPPRKPFPAPRAERKRLKEEKQQRKEERAQIRERKKLKEEQRAAALLEDAGVAQEGDADPALTEEA